MRIALQLLLDLKRKPLHAAPHVGVARRDPDPASRGNWDHDRSAFRVAEISAEDAPAQIRTRASFTSTTIRPGSEEGAAVGKDAATAPSDQHGREARNLRCFPRFPPPAIDKARADIRAPRNFRSDRARLRDLRQNPRTLLIAPAPPTFVPRDQCHPTHAVQLASLLKPAWLRRIASESNLKRPPPPEGYDEGASDLD